MELSNELITQSEAFQARIQHPAYRLGCDKAERACQAIWDRDRGMMPLRYITGWVMAWPGYSGGTHRWVKDSIIDRRLIYVLSPGLARWVTSYKVWDALSSEDRQAMLAWVLLRDRTDLGANPTRTRQRRLAVSRDISYQYTNLITGELGLAADGKSDFNIEECLTPIPDYAVQEGLSVQDISNNPNLMPQND